MPLRGKILNTWEVPSDQVLASQEVHDISVAIGVEPASDNLKNLRYGKICILADADSDGAHIATLLCALFLRHFQPLVEQGHVYVAKPPLYRIDVAKDKFYALDEAERDGILDRITAEKRKGKVMVTRFKGLGEMNPLQLRESAIAPETRRLAQLTIEPGDKTFKIMDMMLAKKRAPTARNGCRPRETSPRYERKHGTRITKGVEKQPLQYFTEKAYLDYSMYVILDRRIAAYRRWPETGATTHYLRDVRARTVGRVPSTRSRRAPSVMCSASIIRTVIRPATRRWC